MIKIILAIIGLLSLMVLALWLMTHDYHMTPFEQTLTALSVVFGIIIMWIILFLVIIEEE